MFDWIVKTPLKVLIKASVISTFLATAAIRLNTFFLLLCVSFYFFQISKMAFKFCYRLSFYSNEYLRKNIERMQISRCHWAKTMVLDNFKRNLHHFNMKKVEHFQLFHLKTKGHEIIIFCKYTI